MTDSDVIYAFGAYRGTLTSEDIAVVLDVSIERTVSTLIRMHSAGSIMRFKAAHSIYGRRSFWKLNNAPRLELSRCRLLTSNS